MEDRQVLVRHSVAIQQNVFGTTPLGFSEDNLEVPRDVDDGIFRCIDKPTVSGSASAQLAGDAMTGIAERAIVKLLVEPGPCLGGQVTAGDIKEIGASWRGSGRAFCNIDRGWPAIGWMIFMHRPLFDDPVAAVYSMQRFSSSEIQDLSTAPKSIQARTRAGQTPGAVLHK